MVKFPTIIQANSRFASDANSSRNTGLVCVFSGATSGTGAGTIERMMAMLKKSTFYILGRSETRFSSQRAKLEGLNPSLKLVFIETDVSMISGIDAACKQILAVEKKVDYLYMSQGCFPLTIPQYTEESLDICFSLSYYSRIRLVMNLLPLLRESSRPRVLSVLNGGREKRMIDDDMGLENAKNWGSRTAINHTKTMTTLAFEYLAENENNKGITFMHAFPGIVATNNFSRLRAPESFGILGKLAVVVLGYFVSSIQRLFGISAVDCGARQAFLLTDGKYGPGVVWRIDDKSEPVIASGVIEKHREDGWREKVWEYTMDVFERL